MQRAFVTGGSGFVGGALIRRLVAEGVAVKALARSETAAAKVAGLGAEPVRGSLEDAPALKQGIPGCDTVFHCAAQLGEWGAPEEFERVNVGGTLAVLGTALNAGVGRFVHVGTEAA